MPEDSASVAFPPSSSPKIMSPGCRMTSNLLASLYCGYFVDQAQMGPLFPNRDYGILQADAISISFFPGVAPAICLIQNHPGDLTVVPF